MLRGYTRVSEQATHLTASMTKTDTTMTVANAKQLSSGVAEIGDELVWIDSVNQSNNTVTIAPYGRGYSNSSVATHAQNERVTFSPMFPRNDVKRAINDTILGLRGFLTGNSYHTFDFKAAKTGYELPQNVDKIIRVEWSDFGSTRAWIPVRRYRLNKQANFDEYPSGKALEIYDYVGPGRTVQVWYSVTPDVMVDGSDDFVDTTGLEDSSRDVVVLGAVARLLSTVDPSRLQRTSVEANVLDEKVPTGSGANAARYVYALFNQRRDEERGRLLDDRPVSTYFTR